MNFKPFIRNHHGKIIKFLYVGFTVSAAALLLFPTPAPAVLGLIFTILGGVLTFVNSILEYHHSSTQYRTLIQIARDKNDGVYNLYEKSKFNDFLSKKVSLNYYKIPLAESLLVINAIAPLMAIILATLKLLAVVDVIGVATMPSILVGLVVANLIITTLIDKAISALIQSKSKELDELMDEISDHLIEEKGMVFTAAIKHDRPRITDNLYKLAIPLLAETLEIDAVSLFNPSPSVEGGTSVAPAI